MKRSMINRAIRDASSCFKAGGWSLPPRPRWDVTDFGLGTLDQIGLVLVNLAEEAEYCEKLMYSKLHQVTPLHTHRRKVEDIICRWGRLAIELWAGHPQRTARDLALRIKRNGESVTLNSGEKVVLEPGERVKIVPGVYHAFWPESPEAIVGEVSTANDDANDNVFVDARIGRFPEVEEDEPALIKLVHEQ
jgi:D-lyxose ketol-isomerase